jgi:hypothetical protein
VTRLIEAEIREWLATRLAIAAASFAGPNAEYERGGRQAIEQVRHLHLSGAEYALVPKIVSALRRANLLAAQPEGSDR